jgi:hypothetical protein
VPDDQQSGTVATPRISVNACDRITAFITLNVRNHESEDHIMRYPRSTAARTRLIPFAALLLATALGGCVGYAEYPSHDYGYNYPSGYYAGYPRTYNASYGYRTYYCADYQR